MASFSVPIATAANASVLEALAQRPLLADGAMGTMLYRYSGQATGCFDAFNLERRDLVQQVHLDYLRAGAEVIQTNTFGATRLRLEAFGRADQVWDINVWGVKVARNAREIAGEPAWVAGSIGPLGRPLQPVGDLSEKEAVALYREQVEGLLAGGCDFFIIETMPDPREALCALQAVRALTPLPVFIQFSFSTEGRTATYYTPAGVAEALSAAGELRPDGIGINCGAGPAAVLAALQEFQTAYPSPVIWSTQPNAGLPTRVGGRLLYEAVPQYFAMFAQRFLQAGVRLLGGCCGTTPAHIAAMRRVLDAQLSAQSGETETASPHSGTAERAAEGRVKADGDALAAGWAGGRGPAGPGSVDDEELHGPGGRWPGSGGSGLQARPPRAATGPAAGTEGEKLGSENQPLGRGGRPVGWQGLESGMILPPAEVPLAAKLGREFVVSVELDPPRGAVARKFLQGAALLQEAGVDVINVADSPMARVRMSALAGAQLISAYTGLETIIHFTTRDRNLMGIQSDLVGAHALGIRNVLALTGDPPSLGDYGHATAVYDVDSIGLIRILRELNEGRDIGGNPIARPTEFTIGAALSPCAQDLPTELERFQAKLEAGAQFVMTQPLYDLQPLLEVLERLKGCPIPLLLGVMPLHSAKHAEYLHFEVPGISIPKPVRDALHKAGQDGLKVGMELAEKVVEEARSAGLIQGVYLVPSFGKYEEVAALVRRLKQTAGSDKGKSA